MKPVLLTFLLFVLASTHLPPLMAQGSPTTIEHEAVNDVVAEHETVENQPAKPDDDPVEEYSEAIRNIELASGAYDQQLQEPLNALAGALSERGEHAEAVSVYSRLLHVSRVNNGFYEEDQLRIVDRIIANNAAQRDWRALNDNHDYLYWLYKRVYQNDRVKLAEGLNKVHDWKLGMLGIIDQSGTARQLLELEQIADELVAATEQAPGGDHATAAHVLYRRALIHYLYAVAIDESGNTARRLAEHELRYLRTGAVMDIAEQAPLFSNVDTKPLILSHLRKGKSAIEQIVASAAADTEPANAKEAEAMARLYLADWELLMDRRDAALNGYREAYALLLEAGIATEQVDAFFSRPVVIPADRYRGEFPVEELPRPVAMDTDESGVSHLRVDDYLAWTATLPGLAFPRNIQPAYLAPEMNHHVELEFDITLRGKAFKTKDPHLLSVRAANGNTSQVVIVEDAAIGEGRKHQALEEVRLLVFRPRLEGGKPVATERVRMKYFFSAGR
ncbi:MAG: hypothetical protein WDZ30_04870 [Cellvibrionaceae bacterium]